jgi:hypothetical protein
VLETHWTFAELDDQAAWDIEGLEHFLRIRAGVRRERQAVEEMRRRSRGRR